MYSKLIFLVLLGTVYLERAYKTNQWENRSTIVQLFEWKWLDIADECERFLAPKGFGGVQISPPSENLIINLPNLKRPWYERYQVMSYKLVTRSGNEADFLNMTTRCNRVGVRIYADVVINHMTGNHKANIGTGGSIAYFNNYSYPAVGFTKDHFHMPPCTICDYNNAQEVRDCYLLCLKDLNHTVDFVRNKISDYMNHLISLGVAGFRLDAAKHMWPKDLEAIYNGLNYLNCSHGFQLKSRPYIYQEVIYYGDGVVEPTEYTHLGDVTEFKYGAELKGVFRGKNAMKWLVSWEESWGLLPTNQSLVFVDNHDTQRGDDAFNYKESRAYKGAVGFMLARAGAVTRIMSSYFIDRNEEGPPTDSSLQIISPVIHEDGTCGNGWVCEHRWRQIYQMIGFRNVVSGTPMQNWWDNGNMQIAFGMGGRGFIAFNLERWEFNETLQTGLPAGQYCDVITGLKIRDKCTGRKILVDDSSYANIHIPSDSEDIHLAIYVGIESRIDK